MTTHLYHHAAFLDHDTGPGHPERADRMRAVTKVLEHEDFHPLVRHAAPLADDPRLRDSLGRAGHAYWATHHTLDVMAADYERLITQAAASPAPSVADLPSHFTQDYSGLAREIAGRFGIALEDVLGF